MRGLLLLARVFSPSLCSSEWSLHSRTVLFALGLESWSQEAPVPLVGRGLFLFFFLIGETQENFVVVEGVRVVRVQWYCLCIVLRAMYSTGNFSKLRSARTSYRYRRVLRRDPLALVSPGSWRGHHFSGAVVAVAVMAVLGTVEEARAFHYRGARLRLTKTGPVRGPSCHPLVFVVFRSSVVNRGYPDTSHAACDVCR